MKLPSSPVRSLSRRLSRRSSRSSKSDISPASKEPELTEQQKVEAEIEADLEKLVTTQADVGPFRRPSVLQPRVSSTALIWEDTARKEGIAKVEEKKVELSLKRQLSLTIPDKAKPSPSKGKLVLERTGSFEMFARLESEAALAEKQVDDWLAKHSHAKSPLPGLRPERFQERLGRQLSFGRARAASIGRQLSFVRKRKSLESAKSASFDLSVTSTPTTINVVHVM